MQPKRRYRQSLRAEQAAQTRRRILESAVDLFMASSYDEVSLEHVAAQSGVAVKTILRRFGSKDGLIASLRETSGERESRVRQVAPGDLKGAARVLARRYEETMDFVLRYLAVEARVPAVGSILQHAREQHWIWLDQTFAPFLPRPRAARRRLLAQLFGATEIYVWHSWRRRLGMSRFEAERALEESLKALLEKKR